MRVQDKAWRDFVKWCAARSLGSLPAHPWTVAAYVRTLESRHRHPAIVKRVRAITRAHLLSGFAPPDKNPLVKRTLRMIRARLRHRPAALFGAEDFLKPPGPAAGAASASAGKRGRQRGLRATPKLVSRRPLRG